MSTDRLVKLVGLITDFLHNLVEEENVTEAELTHAVDFLNKVGKDGQFLLFADQLGLSVKIDAITHGNHTEDDTEHNVEGPLFREGAPLLLTPANICRGYAEGQPLVLSGRVLDSKSKVPIPHAMLDVWQANERGYYENEDEAQPEFNLRGKVQADVDGFYEIRTVVPSPYEIGRTGPVGDLLKKIGRHSWRPAHIHFKVSGDGFCSLTTQLFFSNDPYLGSDSINAVKDSLVLTLDKCEDEVAIVSKQLPGSFFKSEFDFYLQPCERLKDNSSRTL